jgi:hypothetical protein
MNPGTELVVGCRFRIPQWEHSRHCGFAEIIAVGKGSREGKVRIRWPDLSENWNSVRQLLKYNRPWVVLEAGDGRPGPAGDFWVVGEMENVYKRNLERLK